MAKTLLDVDEEALAAAREILGTSSKVDTVNTALREVVASRRRLQLLSWLDTGSDIDDPEAMRGAWR
jgi:Arc/MetJ family transcription regulator